MATEVASILVVDDDRAIRNLLSRRLGLLGNAVTLAAGGQEALDRIRDGRFDLVLLDITMPGLSGLEVLRKIRQSTPMTDLPVVMVTAEDDSHVIVQALELGANDYVTKPIDFPVVKARVQTQILLRRTVRALEEANRKLERLSFVDGLTNIANRRSFDAFLDQEWRRAIRNPAPFSLLLVDIDFFKRYNDTQGHEAGDEVLRRVAGALSGAAQRVTDLVARYGGEEFVAVLPGTSEEGAVLLANEMRAGVEALRIVHGASDAAAHVTVSIGVASAVPQHGSAPTILVGEADRALYEAKRKGRNRVQGGAGEADEKALTEEPERA